MPIVLDGTQGISTPMYAGSISSNPVTPSVNMKNRIINGSMVIDQRNAGASVTASTTSAYTLDRWCIQSSQNSKFTVQQNAGSVTPPAGFTNYLGATSTAATSLGASDYFQIFQVIEGFNCADLAWGTANAKTVTLSFQVRSSLTGTFGGALFGGSTFSYPFTYSISSANTWTTISVTVAGPTSGTWNTTNGSGITVFFDLGSGSTYQGTAGAWASGVKFSATGATSVVGTNGATFYITGVQLEVGSTATSFDYRPYGTELQLCQRYFQVINTSISTTVQYGGYYGNPYAGGTQSFGLGTFKVTMRAAPTVTLYDNAGTAGTVLQNGIAGGIAATADQINVSGFNLVNKTSGSFTTSFGYPILAGFSAAAEL